MNPDDSLSLELSTVADIVRLLGNVSALEGSLLEKKRLLMGDLAELVNADRWLWAGQTSPEAPS